MKNRDNIRKKILNQPSYWIEGINSSLYNAILDYMELNDLNRTKMADYLGISKGRVSQILNDGDINFSIEKIVQIAIKVNKFPVFDLKDKEQYIEELLQIENRIITNYFVDDFYEFPSSKRTKIIPLYSNNSFQKQIALN